jgi:hypothetical protein
MKNLIRERLFFCYHTLVCESIPQDPSWFYLTPLHVTFFTNRAMEIVLRRAGFSGCVYASAERMWVSTVLNADAFKSQLASLQPGYSLVFKEAFVDYWKGTPLRRANVQDCA